MKKLHKEYKKFLQLHKNKERAKKAKRYLYSDLKHYGVDTTTKRKFYKKWKNQIANLSKKEALEYVRYFWKQPSFEERTIAVGIINDHKEKLTVSDLPLIEKLMRESKGWAFLDSLIIPIMPVILSQDKKNYKILEKWIKDNDFWVRRSALLAQNHYFRKNKGNKKLFFKLARSQFDETWIDTLYKNPLQKKRARFFIRKAIGWALREMSEKDPETVFAFLQENKENMSGLSFREGSRKLPTNLRNKLK